MNDLRRWVDSVFNTELLPFPYYAMALHVMNITSYVG